MVNKNIFVRTVGKKQAELEKLPTRIIQMLRNVYALWPHSVCTALDNHVQSYLGLIFFFVFGISLTYPSSQAGEDGSYKKECGLGDGRAQKFSIVKNS